MKAVIYDCQEFVQPCFNFPHQTGAKIIIRGKGSVKDGKIGRKDGQPLPGEDEPLHAYVTANNPENVLKAVEKVWKFVFVFKQLKFYWCLWKSDIFKTGDFI